MKYLKSFLRQPIFYLGIIIFVGAYLRFYNLNWDQGFAFHPDEINIINAVKNINLFNNLNPDFFAYGAFPIYLIRALGQILSKVLRDSNIISSYESLNLIGRYLSAIFSTLSIYLIYVLAKNLFNFKTGLLSALFLALSPGLIQYAHYSVNESLLCFLLLLIAILSLNYYQRVSSPNLILLALFSGLTVSIKITALFFLIIPAIYFIMLIRKQGIKNSFYRLMIFILITCAFYLIFSPYNIIDFKNFISSMRYETSVTLGSHIVPYTIQFLTHKDYLSQIYNLFWQVNPIIIGLGILGLLLWFGYIIKNKQYKLLPILLFGLGFFLYTGSWYTKFVRYYIPMIPILILSASWLMLKLFEIKKLKIVGITLGLLAIIFSFFWSYAYLNIYRHESTRITASNWIYGHIDSESTLLTEEWDFGLPVKMKNVSLEYDLVIMDNYSDDDELKYDILGNNLSRGDYLILSSRRVYGSIMKAPNLYPITSKYYQKLFNEELGYEEIYTTEVYPELWGYKIIDDKAEETFQVYDHPKIYIFKNAKHYTGKEVKNLLLR